MTEVAAIGSIPPLERGEAEALAAEEYGRFEAVLRSLGPSDWEVATECPPWTVRDMATHVLAACEAIGSFRETVHQMRAARRIEGIQIDAINKVQIDERRALTGEDVLRAFPSPLPDPSGLGNGCRRSFAAAAGQPNSPRVTRSPGRSRSSSTSSTRGTHGCIASTSLARPGGRSSSQRPTTAGIVADLVSDWARRHASPVSLTLTGPAGGRFEMGTGGPGIEVEAVTFARNISGRDAPSDGILSIRTPF
jgi:uncharacterized protein (TIGR03083 family)